jgi:hypothetical protein
MNPSLNMGVRTKERFFSFSYLSFSSLLLMCDGDVEGEGLETGEGDP